MRGAFGSAVSHDLRRPLASMKVASSSLLDSAVSLPAADIDELDGLIDVQTDRLTRIVTSLPAMTGFQAGVIEICREPWSVLELVRETVASLCSALEDRSVGVGLAEWLPLFYVDHRLVGQVLASLLESAHLHASEDSPITAAADVRDGWIAISITDSNPGVPPDDHEAIFDRFMPFDTCDRWGLSLAITKIFIQAQGGHIWVEGAHRAGARFVLTLPLTPSNGIGR